MKVKYILHPTTVISKIDGDEHYISALQLSRLYGVNIRECLIDAPGRTDMYGTNTDGLIDLFPRYDGNYKLPKEE